MNRSSKASEVFAVTELLEHIIVQLPIKDIFANATRVAHFWKNVIDKSTTIRRKMFLESHSSVMVPDEYKSSFPGSLGPGYSTGVLELNNALQDLSAKDREILPDAIYPLWHVEGDCIKLHGYEHPKWAISIRRSTNPAPLRDESPKDITPSWHSMYISNPPISVVRLSVSASNYRQRYPYEGDCTIRDSQGVTFVLREETVRKVRQSVRDAYLADGDHKTDEWRARVQFTIRGEILTQTMGRYDQWWLELGAESDPLPDHSDASVLATE